MEHLANETSDQSKAFYNTHTHQLPDIHIGSKVALQNQQIKLWDIYGTVVTIGPHRRYYLMTHSGRVLVRNRRFLRHGTPALLQPPTVSHQSPTTSQHTSPQTLFTPSPQPQEHTTTTRHSTRTRRPPSRLIKDPNWPG